MWIDLLKVLLVWAVPLVLLLAMRRETSRSRTAKDSGDGKLTFELDQLTYWAWLALFVYLLYTVVIQFGGRKFEVSSVWVALVLLLLAVGLMWSFPETITTEPDGLAQEIRFWLKKKKIAWADVEEIRQTKKNRLLVVEGKDGTKIVHTRQLPDRDRLLEELYRNCGDKVPAEMRPVVAMVQELAAEKDDHVESEDDLEAYVEHAGGPVLVPEPVAEPEAVGPEPVAEPEPDDPAVKKVDDPAEG